MRPSQPQQNKRRAQARNFGLSLLPLTLLATLVLTSTASAATAVPLGTAERFAVLAGSTVTNTGPTVINGDLGVSPGSTCTGFQSPCTGAGGTVNGTIHLNDAVAIQAQSDLVIAYDNADNQPCDTDLTGQTLGTGGTVPLLTPGVYCFDTSAQVTGALTLDAQGDPDAVFIFQIGSTLTTASSSSVNLINGNGATGSCNVFWQVGSSATLGSSTVFVGNILALTSISVNDAVTVDGRLLARNGAVTLINDTITQAQCDTTGPVVDISGVPKKTSRDFTMRVRVSDDNRTRTVVYLDGKPIKRTSKTSFRVRIRARRLSRGRHRIRVVSRDAAGNKTVKSRSFLRTGASRSRINFTG